MTAPELVELIAKTLWVNGFNDDDPWDDLLPDDCDKDEYLAKAHAVVEALTEAGTVEWGTMTPTGRVRIRVPDEGTARLLAALDAVLALHVPVAVYSYNDVDGVFDLDEDGELIKLYEVCGTCTPGDTLEALGDCEFTDDDPYTIYPCPTLNAITEALEAS